MGTPGKRVAVTVIARRRRWGVAEARLVISAWRRSRESQARFARRYGLDAQRISRWANRIARDAAAPGPSAGVRFHPVRVIATSGPAGDGTGAIEIALGARSACRRGSPRPIWPAPWRC